MMEGDGKVQKTLATLGDSWKAPGEMEFKWKIKKVIERELQEMATAHA